MHIKIDLKYQFYEKYILNLSLSPTNNNQWPQGHALLSYFKFATCFNQDMAKCIQVLEKSANLCSRSAYHTFYPYVSIKLLLLQRCYELGKGIFDI